MARRPVEYFGKQEAERRFEAALRGAFRTPPMPMKSIAPKRRNVTRRRSKTIKGASA